MNKKHSPPLVGQSFGAWTVIDNTLQQCPQFSKRTHGITMQCKCGDKKVIPPSTLYRGLTLQCKKCHLETLALTKFVGVGQLSRDHYTRIQKSAKKRGLEFNVTPEYLWDIFQKQKGQCALTNLPLMLSASDANNARKKKSYNTASLDRIDSKDGYKENNVQWVHKIVNVMKSNFDQNQFIDFCNLISKTTQVEPRIRVVARVQVEGIHRWSVCPLEEVSYLRNYHRHMFHIHCKAYVNHADRDIEFIQLSHKVRDHLHKKYYNEQYQCLFFGDQSCEMLADDLVNKFNLYECEVNEDGEGGSIVRKI